jgi:hypothetical protein
MVIELLRPGYVEYQAIASSSLAITADRSTA